MYRQHLAKSRDVSVSTSRMSGHDDSASAVRNPARGTAGLERVVTAPFLLCATANFLQALGFNLYLHLPGYLKLLGASEVEIGAIFSITAVAAIVGRPLVGMGMDTWGRRAMILAAGAANVLILALYLTVRDLGPWVYVVRIGHGLTEATLFTAFFTQAADLIPTRRLTEGMALFGVSGLLPISLGALLGDLLLAHGTYTTLFSVSVVLATASFLLSLPMQDLRPRIASEPNRGFFAALVQKDLQPVWLIGAVFATALASYFTFMKTLVLEIGQGSVGSFFTAYTAAALVLRLFLAWVPERFGVKRVLLQALGLLVLGLLVLALASRGVEIVVAGSLCGLGHGFAFPILIGLVVGRARATERGAAISIFTALFDAGVLLGGPLFGAVIQISGYSVMFASAAAMLAAGSAVFSVWDRKAES